MRISPSVRAAVTIVAGTLLAGCAGIAQSSPLATQSLAHATVPANTSLVQRGVVALAMHGAPRLAGRSGCFRGTVFVSDSGANEVLKATPKGKITFVGSGWSEPQGIAVDAAGDVYVADTNNARVVVLTKAGEPKAILSDPGEYPAGVAVAADGTVGVSNILSTSGGGSVSIYAAGATSPTAIATGLLSADYFIGVDANDDFYVDGVNAQSGAVDVGVVLKGSSTIAETGIDASSFGSPGGVNVYRSGKGKKAEQVLGVGDQAGLAVHTYGLPGYAPGAIVPLGGGVDEVEFALDKKRTLAGSADAGSAMVEFWAWPAGGSPTCELTGFSLPVGLGFVPSGDE